MRAFIAAIVGLLALCTAACGQTALLSGAPAAAVIPTPAVNFDVTAAPYNATCNGSGNDSPAFDAVRTAALAYQAANPGNLIRITIPSGKNCVFANGSGPANVFTLSLKKLQVYGYGATLTGDIAGVGTGFFFGSGGSGMAYDNRQAARVATVAAGATQVTLTNVGACAPTCSSIFTVGNYAVIAGIDMQGFGDPPNPYFYEYVLITAKDGACAGTNTICFSAPLAFGYKSTWPLYNAGDTLHSDEGGPATMYPIFADWDVEQTIYGLTLTQSIAQIYGSARSITYKDVTPTNLCPIPTQNGAWIVDGGSWAGCDIEMDKINGTVSMSNTTVGLLNFQSASVNNFSLNNMIVTVAVSGTPKFTTISNSNIKFLRPGAHSYGFSGEVHVNDTVFGATTFDIGGNQDGGINATGGSSISNFNNRGTWVNGLLSIPNNKGIVSAVNNGSGLIRLTLGSDAGLFTGIVSTVGGQGKGKCAGDWNLTVVGNGTQVDLQGSTWTTTVVTGGITANGSSGTLTVTGTTSGALSVGDSISGPGVSVGTTITNNLGGGVWLVDFSQTVPPGTTITTTCVGTLGSMPLTVAVPGANIAWKGNKDLQGPVALITDLTQDATYTYVQTTLPTGGFPTMPLAGGAVGAHTIAATKFYCVRCTGNADVVDLSNAGAQGVPMFQYSQRMYTLGTTTPVIPIFGQMVSTKTTVNTAGAASINFDINGFNPFNPFIQTLGNASTSIRWGFTVDPKFTGLRTILPTSATGSQGADNLSAPGSGAWLLFDQIAPEFSGTPTAGTSVTIEIITNQGVTP